jgi:glucose/arabinose dehydrogenase
MAMIRLRVGVLLMLLVVLTILTGFRWSPSRAHSATVPANFFDIIFATGLTNPTAMAFAPDGRLFVAEQGGTLRVIKNSVLLPTPFLSVGTNTEGERGLLGVAFDPNFESNQFVYIYYTAPQPVSPPVYNNRISRFTAAGDIALPGSEVVLVNLETLSATNHNGGAIHFGPDGKLYVAVGENAVAPNAQTLGNRLGKMLRINADGSAPPDNPFSSTPGAQPSIWALGLRNPFTFAFQPGSGRLFINDVGAGTFEEINDGLAGSNYGWPNSEGPTQTPATARLCSGTVTAVPSPPAVPSQAAPSTTRPWRFSSFPSPTWVSTSSLISVGAGSD